MSGLEFASKLSAFDEQEDDYIYVITKAEAEEIMDALDMRKNLLENKFDLFMNKPN